MFGLQELVFFCRFISCIFDTAEKSTAVSALIDAQLTGFSVSSTLERRRLWVNTLRSQVSACDSPPAAPRTAAKTFAFLTVSGCSAVSLISNGSHTAPFQEPYRVCSFRRPVWAKTGQFKAGFDPTLDRERKFLPSCSSGDLVAKTASCHQKI